MRKKIGMAFVGLLALGLFGCGSKTTAEAVVETAAEETKFVTPTVENGKISLNAEEISESPTFVNYDADGTTVQLIAVKKSDGTIGVSLNTCQACNPSPRAYFVEKNGRLECENCGNVFLMDSVGTSAGGCNPMNVEYEEKDGKIVVEAAELDSYKDTFSQWGGDKT